MIRTPRTLLRGIGQLEPGEILVHESGRVTRRRYWTIDFPEDGAWTTRTRPEWKEAFTAELHDSVRLRMRSDVPLGSWLSAGLDSSAVAALVAGWRPGPLDTFSLRFEDAECDEFEGIRALFDFPEFDLRSHQARCEAAHLELLPDAIWFSEDPSADAGSIARMLTSELAASRVRVVVTGEGADELLGGYHWYAREAVLRRAAALAGAGPRAAVHRSVGGRIGWVARLITTAPEMGAARYAAIVGPMSPVLPGELLADPDGPVEPAPELPPGIDRERYESWSPFNQLQAWDLGVRLPDSILKHVDRASMAYGLEARVPFLDHRLLELCASMPPAMKSGDGKMGKQVLRDSLEGTLPDEIRMREKRGLRTPDDAWMAGPLPDFASELLSSGEVASRGYFRPDSVERVCEMHRSGRAEAGKILLAVLTVHLFDDIFLRGAGPGEALL
jgi:asparagine synthase (glutamine-hydrolysing)